MVHRFYYPQADLSQEQLILNDPKEIHHLKNVLRLKSGSPVDIFNGRGREASGRIQSLGTSEVVILIEHTRTQPTEGPAVILACAIPKKAKFESIIEKAAELGVETIIPLLTQRTEVRLTGPKATQKLIRYQTVAVNAAKQCKRATVPAIYPVTLYKNLWPIARPGMAVLIGCLAEPRRPISEALKNLSSPSEIMLVIGPEGDLTENEIRMAIDAGAIPISMGSTILKVDTAALAGLSAIRFLR